MEYLVEAKDANDLKGWLTAIKNSITTLTDNPERSNRTSADYRQRVSSAPESEAVRIRGYKSFTLPSRGAP